MDDDGLRRRDVLVGAAMMAGLAGCLDAFSNSATETTTEDRTSATGDRTPTSPPTGTVQRVTPGRDQVLAARSGRVVPVSSAGSTTAVDPSETETPVGDAISQINEAGGRPGFGSVLLPPGTITEAEPLVPTQYTRIVGWGINTSVVRFTDLTSDGVRVERLRDAKFCTLDGFTLSGVDSAERSGGSAIHFDNPTANPRRFTIGEIGFREWIDPVVHLERGTPFGSRWGHLEFGFDRNDGREIVVGRNQSLLGTQIGLISAGNRTGDPVVSTTFSGARIHVGFLNIGGSAGSALRLDMTWNGHVSVGDINFESGVTTDEPIVRLDGPGAVRLDHVRNTEGEVGSIVELGRKNAHNVIGRVQNADSVRRGKLEVTDQPAAPSYYFGSADDFVTPFDRLSENVVAFGDMTTADGRPLAEGFSPTVYDSPTSLARGELGVTRSDDGVTLVYRTDDGTVHRWTSDGN